MVAMPTPTKNFPIEDLTTECPTTDRAETCNISDEEDVDIVTSDGDEVPLDLSNPTGKILSPSSSKEVSPPFQNFLEPTCDSRSTTPNFSKNNASNCSNSSHNSVGLQSYLESPSVTMSADEYEALLDEGKYVSLFCCHRIDIFVLISSFI